MERRLAAILAADVVGYTRIMGADEAGTLRRLTDLRENVLEPLITQYHGRIVKLVGDGILVEFSSAVEAVACAKNWQDNVAQHEADNDPAVALQFRIGINLGDVIAEGDDIHGDGVNIAARLESLAQPGGICLSDDVYRHAKGKIDAQFEDIGEQKLKNVADPVRVYNVLVASSAAKAFASVHQPFPLPDKPSIAVLPFVSMSGNVEQEYFADGITEEIITTLSKVPSLLVVARNSTFVYKGRPVDVKQVGSEQGVRYVLEGSIRNAGNRVRITAQLIDAASGHHLWADRYDRSVDDIFELQDEISLKVVTELQVELTDGEMARFRGSGTKNVEAWGKQVRAVASTRVVTKESYMEARRFAEQAALLDPDYSAPLCTLGFINTVEGRHGFSESRSASITEARECATRAIALDPYNPEAYGVLGFANSLEGQHDDAIEKFRMALDINPNHADVTGRLSITLTFNDQPDEAIRVAQKAMRLNPKYPGWYAGVYGFALRVAGRYDQAIDAFHEYNRLADGFGHVDLTIIHATRGELEAARHEASEVLRHRPEFTISKWGQTQLYANIERLQMDKEALRRAGLPE